MTDDAGTPAVVSDLHLSATHTFSKEPRDTLRLVAGLGVEGDAHFGATVKHRSRVRVDPAQPNLRQVHLLAGEVLDTLGALGFTVAPGDLGENVTTRGIDLADLPTGAVLRMGQALVALTGLRNPCVQIDGFSAGLLEAVRTGPGAGVMAVVVRGGDVAVGDPIEVSFPPGERVPLARV